MNTVLHTPLHKIVDDVADMLEEQIPRKFPLMVMARILPHFKKNGG
ncbi:MAG: hypothetical protein U9O82_02150 [Thermodesulfobacteriota bacterium]|nr:hypothetical protein [Thermodesulfobacteriota bacterium]